MHVLLIGEVRKTKQKGSLNFPKPKLKPPDLSILGLSRALESLLLTRPWVVCMLQHLPARPADGINMSCSVDPASRLKTMPWQFRSTCATPGDYSHQECAGGYRGSGFLDVERKAKGSGWSMERPNFPRHNGGPSTAPPTMKYCNWPCQPGIWKKWVRPWRWINHSNLKCRFVLMHLNFFHVTIDLSLPKLNWIPLFLLLEVKGSGALIFGPSPKTLSLPPFQQAPPTHPCQSQARLLSCYQCAKHLLLLFGIVWGWGDKGFDWPRRTYYIWYIACQTRLGPLPSLIPMLCIQPCDGFVVSFLFSRPRVLGLTVLFLPVPPVPPGPFHLARSASVNIRNHQLLCSWSSSEASGEKVAYKSNTWFTDHLFRLSRGQHSLVLCPHVCLACPMSIQTEGMAALGSSKICCPVAWNALLFSICPSVPFLNFPTQPNACLIWEAFPDPHPCSPFPPITLNHCAYHLFGSCLVASCILGWCFPWHRERASQGFGISHTWG